MVRFSNRTEADLFMWSWKNSKLLEELARAVRSNSELVRATAEARAEGQWEHKLLLIPILFLALSTAALAGFKLRDLTVQKQ